MAQFFYAQLTASFCPFLRSNYPLFRHPYVPNPIRSLATEAKLSENCFDRIKKAKRVVVAMVATLAFFYLTLKARVEALALTPEVEQAVYDNLVPAIYLHLVAQKTQAVSQRQLLQTQSK